MFHRPLYYSLNRTRKKLFATKESLLLYYAEFLLLGDLQFWLFLNIFNSETVLFDVHSFIMFANTLELIREGAVQLSSIKHIKYIFKNSNNFLRLCVLKVTQQSEKHLEKILNVDEFVKRIFSVIHSNDPVARAITLRYACLSRKAAQMLPVCLFIHSFILNQPSPSKRCCGQCAIYNW